MARLPIIYLDAFRRDAGRLPFEDNRYRPVILDLDKHVSTKHTLLDLDPLRLEMGSEVLDQRFRQIRLGGADKTWSSAFTRICVKCELRNYNRLAARIEQ